MKRKFLEDLGLEKEAIDKILDENGRDIATLKSENEGYKGQLETAQATLKSFEGVNVSELQGKIQTLTSDLAKKDSEIQEKLAGIQFEQNLKEALTKSGAKNTKAVMALLEIDGLKKSKNQVSDMQAAIDAIKKDNDYLFQDAKPAPRIVASTPGADPNVASKNAQANEALRSLFGRE